MTLSCWQFGLAAILSLRVGVVGADVTLLNLLYDVTREFERRFSRPDKGRSFPPPDAFAPPERATLEPGDTRSYHLPSAWPAAAETLRLPAKGGHPACMLSGVLLINDEQAVDPVGRRGG
jgi:hypothetical protein